LDNLDRYLASIRLEVDAAAAARTRDDRRRQRMVDGVMRKVAAWAHPPSD
jgi:hypothetical protein